MVYTMHKYKLVRRWQSMPSSRIREWMRYFTLASLEEFKYTYTENVALIA